MASSVDFGTYLGFDWSTQKLKAGIVNDRLELLHETEVSFDDELPEFRTIGGVWRNEKNNLEVRAPPLMWVKALDLILEKLIRQKADFSKITSLTGAAQQHGAVWWSTDAEAIFAQLDPKLTLGAQMVKSFIGVSPVWQDSSSGKECALFEKTVGPRELARATGSGVYERFTGPQILKFKSENKTEWENCSRISLVSSAACSLFLGKIAPIDYSDGSGMNLLDINVKTWFEPTIQLCGGDELKKKLGTPVPSNTILGNISDYFVKRYGFNHNCKVIAFTGDNPASIVGLRLHRNTAAVSLGTSDTVFLGLNTPVAPIVGHILVGPTSDIPYMALLCFTNGSLTREKIIKNALKSNNIDWQLLECALQSTPMGNDGNMGIYYETTETVPKSEEGTWRWNKDDQKVDSFPLNTEIRALLESQAIARRVHAEDMGLKLDSGVKLVATGGAAASKPILQTLSDVFNTEVYVQEYANSTILGSAIRAAEAIGRTIGQNKDFWKLAATPHHDAKPVYESMIKRYRNFVETRETL